MDSSEVRKLAKRSQKDRLENSFYAHWHLLYGNLPPPERQFPVLNPKTGRFYKLDFAFQTELLAVEISGGAWVQGSHNRAGGQAHDYERHNHLTRLGWRVLYYNTVQCKHMEDVVTEVAEILCSAKDI